MISVITSPGELYAQLKTEINLMVFYFLLKYTLSVSYPRINKKAQSWTPIGMAHHVRAHPVGVLSSVTYRTLAETFLTRKMGIRTFTS